MKVKILGTMYKINVKTHEQDSTFKKYGYCGYCDSHSKQIVVLDLESDKSWRNESKKCKENAMKETLRHEVVHAYLNESGLKSSALKVRDAWARNEEMVDWIALQFPKMLRTFKKLNCI